MDVNSVAVRVTVRTSGAGNASALRTSRASVGLDGRGSGPVRGSRGGCEVIGRLSLPRHCTDVPARNTIFLSFAVAWAEVVGAADVFIGVTALDYSGYPDCRPEYIAAFQAMADLATRAGVEGRQRLRIHTPLIALSKREIILTGLSLGLDYALTSSCYDPAPGGEACGRCDACLLRLKGFAEAGTPDPIRYRAGERVSR